MEGRIWPKVERADDWVSGAPHQEPQLGSELVLTCSNFLGKNLQHSTANFTGAASYTLVGVRVISPVLFVGHWPTSEGCSRAVATVSLSLSISISLFLSDGLGQLPWEWQNLVRKKDSFRNGVLAKGSMSFSFLLGVGGKGGRSQGMREGSLEFQAGVGIKGSDT